MQSRSLSHLTDHELTRALAAKAACERTSTADLLAHIAEFDARKLYLPAGYDSMYAYCVHELHMSDDSALKRIRAARAAHQFPAIVAAIATGRLHLSGVAVLARHLTPENANELLAAAEHKTRVEIQLLVAQRFPQPDLPTRVEALPGPRVSSCQTLLAPGPVDVTTNGHGGAAPDAAGQVAPPAPRAKTTPLAPGRFAFQGTMPQSMHDKLEYLRALLGHQVP